MALAAIRLSSISAPRSSSPQSNVKIYTRTGDAGDTGLFSGERVPKDHPRVCSYGSVDECNSFLGAVISLGCHPEIAEAVSTLQHLLFKLGADLATKSDSRHLQRVSAQDVLDLEQRMDALHAVLPPLRAFILPGGTPAAACLQIARAVCRRAEREAITASRTENLNPQALIVLNRLSDYLFLLARRQNQLSGCQEPEWQPDRKTS